MVDEIKVRVGQIWRKRDATRGTVKNYSLQRIREGAAPPFAEFLCLETGLRDSWALASITPENGWSLVTDPKALYEIRYEGPGAEGVGEPELALVTVGQRWFAKTLFELGRLQARETALQAEQTRLVEEIRVLRSNPKPIIGPIERDEDARSSEREAVLALLQGQIDYWRGKAEHRLADATFHIFVRIQGREHLPKEASRRPVCDTPGCERIIPEDGEGVPEICPVCLACLELHERTIDLAVKKGNERWRDGLRDLHKIALRNGFHWTRLQIEKLLQVGPGALHELASRPLASPSELDPQPPAAHDDAVVKLGLIADALKKYDAAPTVEEAGKLDVTKAVRAVLKLGGEDIQKLVGHR